MDVSPDYEDLFKILNSHKIKYLVVGGYAAIYHSQPRYTKDIDVWIVPDLNDVHKVYAALSEYGAPLTNLEPEDFANRQLIYQIGVAPVRIDILMNIEGVSFQTAWKNRKRVKFGETPIHILSYADIIRAKRRAGRPQDLLDIENMKKAKR